MYLGLCTYNDSAVSVINSDTTTPMTLTWFIDKRISCMLSLVSYLMHRTKFVFSKISDGRRYNDGLHKTECLD